MHPVITRKVRYKRLKNFPGYAVGDDGTVISCLSRKQDGKWRRMKPHLTDFGHHEICLSYGPKGNRKQKQVLVHRLVLETFVGPCPPGMECRHFPDRNPINNRVENLSWGTHITNVWDRVDHGTDPRGMRNGNSRLTDDQVVRIHKLFQTGNYTKKKLGQMFRVSDVLIGYIIRGKLWSHLMPKEKKCTR